MRQCDTPTTADDGERPGDGYIEVPALDGTFDQRRILGFDWVTKCWSGTGAKWCIELERTFGCQINDVYGGSFWSDNETGRLCFFGNYSWDGASGPTLDDPALWLASAVHDAICFVDAKGRRVVPGYWKRHQIYRRIMAAHCPYPSRIGRIYHFLRTWKHWLFLVLFNWAWSLRRRDGR